MSDQNEPTAVGAEAPAAGGKKTGASEPNLKQSESRNYLVTFRHNRSFELTIGRETIFFAPHGQQRLTEKQVNNPDFQQQRDYFVVQEAK